MKKQLLVVLLALVMAFSLVACVACDETPATYTLTYAAGEGSGTAPAASSYEEGAEVKLAANTFTAPEGKEFDGWLVDGAKKAAGDTITMPAKDITATAQWKTTTVTPDPDMENPVTLYFYNADGWTDVNAYVWDEDGIELLGNWPGSATTAVDGHDKWVKATIDADLEVVEIKVIFNGDGKQTKDLTLVDATHVYFAANGAYTSFEEAEEGSLLPPETTTVYYYNSDNWDEVYAYVFMGDPLGGWPGSELTAVADHEGWYEIAIDADMFDGSKNIIFNNNDKGSQTGDLVMENSTYVYFIHSDDEYAFASFEDAEAALNPLPPQPTVTPSEAWVGTYDVVEDGEDEYVLEISLENGVLTVLWDEDEVENVKLEEVEGAQQLTFDVTSGLGSMSFTTTYVLTLAEDGTLTLIETEEIYEYEITKRGNTAQKYTVTFVKSTTESQIESVVGSVPATAEVAEGATITMPAANTLTLAHYTLTSWRVFEFIVPTDGTDAYWAVMYEDGKAVNIAPGATYTMPGKNIQIKAVWTANYVTISFDANGGSGEIANVTNKQYNSTYSLPQTCAFTAPAGMEFEGWATSANGALLDGGLKLDASVVSAEDTVTIYAIWKSSTVTPTTPLIDDIKGSWTATGHTIDIIADTDAENEVVKGYAILDGTYFLVIIDSEGAYFAYTLDYSLLYTVTLSEGTLTLDPGEEGSPIALSGKTTLTNAARSTFEGNWVKSNVAQKWIITADEVYYGVTDLKQAAISMVVGNYIAIVYEVSIGNETYNYTYVLAKQGDNLEGWFVEPEKTPTAVIFIPGDYVTLTVNGKLNQTVNSGSAPDASKLTAPTAPEGQIFDKWVLAGTETEFDVTATMTQNASIEAKYKDAPLGSIKTYTGSATKGFYSVTKVELNTATQEVTLTIKRTLGGATESTLTGTYNEANNAYKMNEACDTGDILWVVITDENTVSICGSYMNAPDMDDELWGTLTLET